MTTLSSLLDLDDADALVAADVDGALRSAALAGAQVRATVATFTENVADRLDDLRPRSVVFVSGHGRAGRAAELLVAATSGRLGVPLVRAPGTPPWVGPLDVVVIFGDDAGDPRLALATSAAVRRGAETVLVTPDEGPLRSAAAGRAVFVPPRIAVREHNTLMRYLTAGLCVLSSLSGGVYRSMLPDLDRLADTLDDESARDHPSHEVFHNPAKAIASRVRGSRVVLTGVDPVAMELARHASEVFFRAAAVVTATAELTEVVAAAVGTGAAAPVSADYDPLFHDEQLDGPRPEAPLRVFVAASAGAVTEAERRTAVLDDVVVVAPDDAPAMVETGERGPSERDDVRVLEAMALLATRLEIAAAYLHVMGGN